MRRGESGGIYQVSPGNHSDSTRLSALAYLGEDCSDLGGINGQKSDTRGKIGAYWGVVLSLSPIISPSGIIFVFSAR